MHIDQLVSDLNGTTIGAVALDTIQSLWPYKSDLQAKSRVVLISYTRFGKIGHVRTHLVSRLGKIASPITTDLAEGRMRLCCGPIMMSIQSNSEDVLAA
jgi:hypothetical protein